MLHGDRRDALLTETRKMTAVVETNAKKKIIKKWRGGLGGLVSFADSAYRETILLFNSEWFCVGFNLRAKLGRKEVRIEYDRDRDTFFANSTRYRRQFRSRYQNYNTYRNGLSERGVSLGREYFCDKIPFIDGDVVVDCGANVGDLQIYFEEQKLQIEYIGLEPSPSEFACLEANVAPSRAYNVGLWSDDCTLSFYVSTRNADSSLVDPGEYTREILVKARRLDSLLDCRIKLLKLEAEGAEPEVLIGCEKILGKIDFIAADLGFERGVSQESTLPEVTNFLLKHNFEMIELNQTRLIALFQRVS